MLSQGHGKSVDRVAANNMHRGSYRVNAQKVEHGHRALLCLPLSWTLDLEMEEGCPYSAWALHNPVF